jgi:hypothetical protein
MAKCIPMPKFKTRQKIRQRKFHPKIMAELDSKGHYVSVNTFPKYLQTWLQFWLTTQQLMHLKIITSLITTSTFKNCDQNIGTRGQFF